MSVSAGEGPVGSREKGVRTRELFAFFLLSVLIWPVIAVGVVASWGFVVWMSHAFLGLPGPGH